MMLKWYKKYEGECVVAMAIKITEWDIVSSKKNGKEYWILQGYCLGVPIKVPVKKIKLIRIGLNVKGKKFWYYCEYNERKIRTGSVMDDEGFQWGSEVHVKKKSDGILDDLFEGRIYPAECVVVKTEEYKNVIKGIEKNMTYFQEKMSEEDFVKLENLYTLMLEGQNMMNKEQFKCGLGMGVLLMKEIYEYSVRV